MLLISGTDFVCRGRGGVGQAGFDVRRAYSILAQSACDHPESAGRLTETSRSHRGSQFVDRVVPVCRHIVKVPPSQSLLGERSAGQSQHSHITICSCQGDNGLTSSKERETGVRRGSEQKPRFAGCCCCEVASLQTRATFERRPKNLGAACMQTGCQMSRRETTHVETVKKHGRGNERFSFMIANAAKLLVHMDHGRCPDDGQHPLQATPGSAP